MVSSSIASTLAGKLPGRFYYSCHTELALDYLTRQIYLWTAPATIKQDRLPGRGQSI